MPKAMYACPNCGNEVMVDELAEPPSCCSGQMKRKSYYYERYYSYWLAP